MAKSVTTETNIDIELPESQTERLGPSTTEREGEWLVIRGQLPVAFIHADCAECAFLRRDKDYPGCQLAVLVNEDKRMGVCFWSMTTEERLRRQGWTEEQVREWQTRFR